MSRAPASRTGFRNGIGAPVRSDERSLSFGKLTMTDTDLELVDTDPRDPFDFAVDHWNAQLVAGYSKTLPDRGLKAYLPDYDDLKR